MKLEGKPSFTYIVQKCKKKLTKYVKNDENLTPKILVYFFKKEYN